MLYRRVQSGRGQAPRRLGFLDASSDGKPQEGVLRCCRYWRTPAAAVTPVVTPARKSAHPSRLLNAASETISDPLDLEHAVQQPVDELGGGGSRSQWYGSQRMQNGMSSPAARHSVAR